MPRTRPAVEPLEERSLPSSAQYVTALYADFLNRAPSPADLASFVNRINTGTAPTTVAASIVNSDEFHDIETRNDYVQLLGRQPSGAELLAWEALRRSGVSGRQEAAGFLSSDEYFARQGGTGQGWLSGLYFTALGRAPDAAALGAFLPQALGAQGVRAQVASVVLSSPESNSHTVQNAYTLLLRRSADSAGLAFWINQLNSGLPVPQMLADLAGSPEYITTRAGGLDVPTPGVTAATTAATTFGTTTFTTTPFPGMMFA